jgi:predicted O-methyltransferase YrrM
MFTSLLRPEIQSVLDRLHTLADDRDEAIIQQFLDRGHDWQSSTSEQKAVGLGLALLPISKDVGKFLYGVARSISAKHIVEFGTSYGVSTIYFAAALRDLGGGLVVGSELESSKVMKANQHLAEAGLSKFAEIRAGDGCQTLRDPGGTIDLLFLDGWKDLYLDVLHLALVCHSRQKKMNEE